MDHPEGASDDGSLRVDFDRRLRLEFHGSRITSDAGLLAYRELDDALGLSDLAGGVLSECRRGKNTRHMLTGLFRQSVVDDRAARAAGEDRRQDRPPRPVDGVSDGRGRGAARSLPGNSECDRHAPPVATGPMLRIGVIAARRVYWRETCTQIGGRGSEDPPFWLSLHCSRGVGGL